MTHLRIWRNTLAGLALAWATATTLAQDDIVRIGKDNLWNAPRPEKPDLSVQTITRLPRYPGLDPEYVKIDNPVEGVGETGPVKIKNEGAQRWPQPGDRVTYIAKVRNVGSQPVARFRWNWLYDGHYVRDGRGWREEPLGPGETVEFKYERRWDAGRHAIAFEVDPDNLIDEITDENNWVVDRTDALSFAFFVEESVLEWFQGVRNGLGSYDWVDWAQFQVREINKCFRDTIYPSCPDGIEERVRLDVVYVIPDGWGHKQGMHTPGVKTPVNLASPEFYNANTAAPETLEVFNNINGGVDGVWGFSVDLIKPDPQKGGDNFYEAMPRWITGAEWPLQHELGHQLGRADHYLIWSDKGDNPIAPGMGWERDEAYKSGMMHHGNYAHDNAIGMHKKNRDSTYRFYSEHTARSFNRDKGVRRGLFGEYFFDVPTSNAFAFLDPQGQTVKQGKVEVFVGRGRGYTGCGMNEKPNFVGEIVDGEYALDRSPWEHVFIWGNNGVVMFRVTPPGGAPLIGFRDIGHFNVEVWRGAWRRAQHVVPCQPIEK